MEFFKGLILQAVYRHISMYAVYQYERGIPVYQFERTTGGNPIFD